VIFRDQNTQVGFLIVYIAISSRFRRLACHFSIVSEALAEVLKSPTRRTWKLLLACTPIQTLAIQPWVRLEEDQIIHLPKCPQQSNKETPNYNLDHPQNEVESPPPIKVWPRLSSQAVILVKTIMLPPKIAPLLPPNNQTNHPHYF
jgi:hypothetical protein